jgi:hypothetical protein
MDDRPSSRDLWDRAWAEVADLLDRQLSPLGLAAIPVGVVTATA